MNLSYGLDVIYMADHPKLSCNHNVKRNKASAERGFAIVRGPDPIACGQLGDFLAFAKETHGGKNITQVSLAQIDGKEYLPDVWYDADLLERKVKH